MRRDKKSAKFTILEGNPGKRSNTVELKSLPAPATDRPRSPKWLGPYAMEFHRENWPLVEAMGTYTLADKTAWFIGCQRVERIRQAEAEIDRSGLVVKGRGDELKRNPACAILKAELDLFRRFCESFGLEPSARGKMGLKVQKETPMSRMID